MIRILGTGAWLTAITCLPCPGIAQTVVHSGSQITIPARFDEMAVKMSAGPGKYGDLATAYTYQNAEDLVEINVFRASYPSASLWFAQALTRTKQLFSTVDLAPIGNPEPFTIKADKPNGIRAFYKVGAPFVSTSVAVVSFGPWLVSIHSTSKSLDVSQQRARLDRIVAQIVPPSPVTSVYPLTIPIDCPASKQAAFGPEGDPPLSEVSLEMKTSGGLAAMIASKDAVIAGDKGIAAQPATYCRRQSTSGKTVWYETLDAIGLQRWVLPVSETGVTIEGVLVPTTDKLGNVKMLGALLTNDLSQTSVRGFYASWPNPVSSQLRALSALLQSTTPYATVKYGTNELVIAQ